MGGSFISNSCAIVAILENVALHSAKLKVHQGHELQNVSDAAPTELNQEFSLSWG